MFYKTREVFPIQSDWIIDILNDLVHKNLSFVNSDTNKKINVLKLAPNLLIEEWR